MRTNWHAAWLRLFPLGALALGAACGDETVAPKLAAPDAPRAVLNDLPTIIPDDWNGGPLHGAIFTTLPFGQSVNANVQYTRKIEVYLDGGPRNPNSLAAGLNDGLYVFQITDPSGKYLLSQDPARCRVVQVKGGVIVDGGTNKGGTVPAYRIPNLSAATDKWSDAGNEKRVCHVESAESDGASLAGQHDTNDDSDAGGGATVQMMPFGTTPNPGGVYKAWITPLAVYAAKAGGYGALNTIPVDLKGQAGSSCPDFCATPDLGFKNPSRNNVKTDNFKVKENPPFLSITKYVDGVAATQWHVTVFELLAGDWNGKGWTDDLPATFAVPLNTDLLACESVPAGYRFVSATVGGSAAVVATAANTTPAPPTEDDRTPPNAIVCVKAGPLASAGTVAVAFNNHKLVPDARISIWPDGVNEVGRTHTFTAHVDVNPDESAWSNAPDGTVITFATTGSGTFIPASKTCTTAGGTGSCSIGLTNSNVGTDVVSASTTLTVAGTSLTRTTNGVAPNGGPATKYWVDAYVTIRYDARNPVGEPHTFTANFSAKPGAATPTTFNSLTITVTPPAGFTKGVEYTEVTDCATPAGSGNERSCTTTINSSKPGVYTAHATGSVTMGADQASPGATLVRATDGTTTPSGLKNSVDAVKTYYQPAGCTPGFWKQEQHFGFWHDSPFSPVDPKTAVSTAFTHFTGQGGATDGYDKFLTLIGALDLDNSNGIGQVLRHGTAALLNAYSKGVLYGYGDDPQQVKDAVNAALDAYGAGNQAFVDAVHAKLASYNELGCPLGGQSYW